MDALHRQLSLSRSGIFHALCLLVLALLATPLAALDIVVEDADGPTLDLAIGDDLWIHITGAPANTWLDIKMFDEGNTLVESQLALTDAQGTFDAKAVAPGVTPRPFMPNTNIVGCRSQPWPAADPTVYEFLDHDEADILLDGRTFDIDVEHDGILQGSTTVTFAIDPTIGRLFPADTTGCMNYRPSVGTPIYLEGIRFSLVEDVDLRVWVMKTRPVDVNDLEDERVGYPNGQDITVVAGQTSLHEFLVDSPGSQLFIAIQIGDFSDPTMVPPIAMVLALNEDGGGGNTRDPDDDVPPPPTPPSQGG